MDKIAEYKRKHYLANAEYLRNYQKRYRVENPEILRERKHDYYQRKKEEIKKRASEKIECPCGSIVQKCVIRKHERTDKHKKFIERVKSPLA